MIEIAFDALNEDIEDLRVQFSGVTTGEVVSLEDPFFLGRVQVRLPFLDALTPAPWARIALPMGGMAHGFYFIPNVGDQVLVAFEGGDPSAPYILGSLWTAVARPPMSTPQQQTRAIRTLSGNQIVFEETSPAITLQTAPTPPETLPIPASPVGPHQTVRLSPEGIKASGTTVELVSGESHVVVTPESISIRMPGSSVNVSPTGVEVRAPMVTIQATGLVDIRGKVVKINS